MPAVKFHKNIQFRVTRWIKDAGLSIFFIYFTLFYTKKRLKLFLDFFLGKPLTYVLKEGIILKTEKRDIRAALAVHEIYVQQVYTNVLGIEKGDLVVDIGATNGDFSIFAAKKTPQKVIACEPCPENIRLLKLNIKHNYIKNIIVEDSAIGDGQRRRKIFLSNTSEQHSFYKRDINIKWKKESYVKTLSLVDLFNKYQLKQIGFLKIDCEGAEGEIFKSTPISYLKRINKISLEFHDAVSILNHRQIMKLLENAGFKVWLKGNDKAVYGYIYAKNRYLS